MKLIIKPMYVLCFMVLALVSCNNEELFVEPTSEVVVEDDTTVPDDNDTVAIPPVSTPCDFNLNNVAANATVIINCVMDLGGQTITLPAGVTLVYEGGDIINGTINFGTNNLVSGELLNSSLTIAGTKPQMKDPVFNFDAKRWGIVEGVVNDEVAYNNKLIINEIMQKVKSLGASTIKIDKLDAYFQTQNEFNKSKEAPEDAAIQIPADIHLKMTDNTHLRVQPNKGTATVLLTVFKADNTIVEGGILHGDRDTHDYSSGGTQEWLHTLLVKASKNVTIKNMTLMDAGGDGIEINAYGHAYDSYYTYCENVTITGNKIIRARRNGLSLTDGRNIIIENNEFIDSGISTNKSNGAAPMWAIDIEPYRPNATVYEIVNDITIKNNIEKGSEKGGFLIYSGDRITIENNTMENGIAYRQTSGSIIRNNTVIGVSELSKKDRDGITAETQSGNNNNLIYGNTVKNFNKGIIAGDYNGLKVYDNVISNCGKAIGYGSLINAKIYSNTITTCGLGIGSEGLNVTLNNTEFYDNVVNDCELGTNFYKTNFNEKANSFVVKNNVFNANRNSDFKYVYGLEFDNNTVSGGLRINGVENSRFTNNTISGGDGFTIEGWCKDISIVGNTIIGKCFYEPNATTNINIVKENNKCN
ncbi:right-handed parallel beta-helix repeat-containing protein [Mariniflexile aquimaris]